MHASWYLPFFFFQDSYNFAVEYFGEGSPFGHDVFYTGPNIPFIHGEVYFAVLITRTCIHIHLLILVQIVLTILGMPFVPSPQLGQPRSMTPLCLTTTLKVGLKCCVSNIYKMRCDVIAAQCVMLYLFHRFIVTTWWKRWSLFYWNVWSYRGKELHVNFVHLQLQ